MVIIHNVFLFQGTDLEREIFNVGKLCKNNHIGSEKALFPANSRESLGM